MSAYGTKQDGTAKQSHCDGKILVGPNGQKVALAGTPWDVLKTIMAQCFDTPGYCGDETDVTFEVVFAKLRENGWRFKEVVA